MRFLILILCAFMACNPNNETKESPLPQKQIVEYKDEARIALPDGDAKELVIANCVHCHSHRIILQNSANREGWKSMITWMQEKHGLWPLGAGEEQILNYLTDHFAPSQKGRRSPLKEVQWYVLD